MKATRCIGCGYDLRDFDHRIDCPDCGLPIAESRRARERAWMKIWWILALAAGVVVVTIPLLVHEVRQRWWPEPAVVSRETVRAETDELLHLVREWMGDYGRTKLPSNFTLDRLVEDGMYAGSGDLLDPWGNAYVIDTGTMRVLSYGADGLPGGVGDAKDILSAPLP